MGAQFESDQQQAATAMIAPAVPLANGINIAVPCPYHSTILNMAEKTLKNTVALQRYMGEGPGEQHALFVRADNGLLSTSRGCHCVAR